MRAGASTRPSARSLAATSASVNWATWSAVRVLMTPGGIDDLGSRHERDLEIAALATHDDQRRYAEDEQAIAAHGSQMLTPTEVSQIERSLIQRVSLARTAGRCPALAGPRFEGSRDGAAAGAVGSFPARTGACSEPT